MLHVDLEEVSSKQIRQHLEEDMEMDLNEFRSFIDQTIMVILGQMEKPSMIKDYLYLVSDLILWAWFSLCGCGGPVCVWRGGGIQGYPKLYSNAHLSV